MGKAELRHKLEIARAVEAASVAGKTAAASIVNVIQAGNVCSKQ